MAFSSIPEIITDLRLGKMVIIVDDEDRENEGDLLMVASLVRDQDINFMARYGRGLICLTLSKERCERLKLPLMVSHTQDSHGTNFTVSIEAARGVTTGISAADRAITIQAAVATQATSDDIVQPGHVFPLMAQPGGVLTRAGHTEAGCDLARLAGFEPAAVIVEILNEDGTMARRADLEKVAEQHQLKMGTIEALIRYRLETETTLKRVAESPFLSEYGQFQLVAYRHIINNDLHFALVKGPVVMEQPTLVRVHMENTFCDLLHWKHHPCGWPLMDALQVVANAPGAGVVILLRQPYTDEELRAQMQQLRGSNQPLALTPSMASAITASQPLRTYGVGAQILSDLGVKKMRVLGAPRKVHSLAGFGLEIVDYVRG